MFAHVSFDAQYTCSLKLDASYREHKTSFVGFLALHICLITRTGL